MGCVANLKIWLSNETQPQLLRTWFEHPRLSRPCVSIRGKKESPFENSGTFQWTPAVQALTLLLLRTAAVPSNAPRPVLEGERGGPSSSLGFILLKKPAWLREMFGELRPGDLIISHLVRTYNVGGRRPGSIALAIQEQAGLGIEVYVQETRVTDPALLEELARKIEALWRPHRKGPAYISSTEQSANGQAGAGLTLAQQIEKLATGTGSSVSQDFNSIIRRLLEEECRARLWKTDIFSHQTRDKIVDEIYEQRLFAKFVGKRIDLLHSVDRSLATSERLGVSQYGKDRLAPPLARLNRPLKVALPVISTATKACFYQMRAASGIPLELMEGFTHSGDILEYILRNPGAAPIDFIPLGIGTVAEVLKRQKDFPYVPFMVLPKHSLRIVAPKGPTAKSISNSRLNTGNYIVTGDGPTSPRFALDDLFQSKILSESRVKVSYAEPDESFQLLKSGDPELRSLLFFPHYHFNAFWNGCRLLGEQEEQHQMRDTILMVHEELVEELELLREFDIALRDAWLCLRSSEKALSATIDDMMVAPNFLPTLKRSAGLYSVPTLLKESIEFKQPARA